MNNKLLMAFRLIFSVALLIIFAGLLTTTTVQSADPNAINAAPTLRLVKNVTIDDGGTAVAGDWDLTATGDTLGFTDSGDSIVFHTVTENFGYALSESTVAGYQMGSWSCPGGSLVDSTVTLGPDDDVTCTITNDDIAPTLKLVKNVTKDDGGTAVAGDWDLTATGDTRGFTDSGDSIVFHTVTAGVGYALSESTVAGYQMGSWLCPGGSLVDSTVTLGLDDDVTCTITNDDIPPLLTLVKIVTNDNGFTAAPDDFLLTVGGSLALSGVQYPYTANTPLVINETQLPGYKFVSITGDAKCPTTLGGEITMDLGDVITCTITNNDVGFNITPTSLLTSESGLPDTFDVVLDTIPTANVTLALSSPPLAEGTIDKTSLTFTVAKWNESQTVTITGVDDFVADGDQVYDIVTGTVTTADPDYASLNPGTIIPDISVTNSDDDTPGFTIAPNTGLWTSEGGAAETIQILLKSRPTSLVTLNIVSSDTDEGTVSLSSITINPNPWPPAAPKQFTVTGVDDCKTGGDNFKVTITGTSSDPNYDGRKEVLNLTNYDAPTIAWVEPVGNEEFYDSDGSSPINLKVISLCPEPIQKVRFYRWSTAIGDNVTIGEDLAPPYDEILFADELEPGVNQIRAFAFSPANPVSTFSEHELIFITLGDLIYLPLVYK